MPWPQARGDRERADEGGESPVAVHEQLKAIGVRVILDDFGTGYSSLGYLERLPLDGLKIDRSFIVGLTEKATSRAIFSAVNEMAGALGLSVVAEGIETSDQMQLVEVLGRQYRQGYLFAGRGVVAGHRSRGDTPEQQEFDRIVAAHGLKAALVWCDGRHGRLQ